MPLTILVADDDLGVRLSISDYLETTGYSVISAENGKVALEMVEEYRPHLIVTDIMMPQMDGYEFVRQVRQRPASRLTPVIFLTSRGSKEERIIGYQMGCDFYLPKPFDMDELKAMVRNLLERSQIIQSEWQARSPMAEALGERDNPTQPSQSVVSSPSIRLTAREREVLNLLLEGLSNAQIGSALHLSPRTIEKYVSSLLRKTITNNRAELVRFAMEHHLVQWEES